MNNKQKNKINYNNKLPKETEGGGSINFSYPDIFIDFFIKLFTKL